ncbi:hypothetical protein [Streptomyces virginiae]|uniref:hypothetical protein n=1 Tax=Streptomyces virginiae TaxID=1961 RepID=UPI003434C2B3
MEPLPKPVLDARTAYATCISKARPAKTKARLQKLEDQVATAAADYEKAAAGAALHTLDHLKGQPDGDDENASGNKALTGCYTSRMARKGSPGRALYERLLAAAKGLCPLCGHGYANTQYIGRCRWFCCRTTAGPSPLRRVFRAPSRGCAGRGPELGTAADAATGPALR